MQTLIINLAHVTERRFFQERQLSHLGLEFEFIEALRAEDADQLKPSDYWNTYQRPLRDSEKACFLSHLKCWEKVVRTNRPMLILEDDALLSDKLPEFLSKLSNINNIDVLNLETRSRRIFIGKPHGKIEQIRQLFINRDGAAAYVLWPQGAQKLLNKAKAKSGIADAFIWGSFELDTYQTTPALALQSDHAERNGLPHYFQTKSSIVKVEHEPAPKATDLFPKLIFKTKRITVQFALAFRQLRILGRSNKTKLNIEKQDFAYLAEVQKQIK